MPYIPFFNYFPETAARETRTVTSFADPVLPKGEYGFTEAFCDECDCRRAVINVMNVELPNPSVATISYGWGTRSFYIKWFGSEDQDILDDMMGASLMTMAPQSQYADYMLAMFIKMIETDPEYEKRIRRHYSQFRKKIKRTSN